MKIELIDFPETSVRNYHYSLHNNPEEHSSHLDESQSSETLNGIQQVPSDLLLNAYSRERAEFRIVGTVAKGQTFLSSSLNANVRSYGILRSSHLIFFLLDRSL